MADEKIAVRPARKGMALSHPVAGPLRDDGGEWPADAFTYRRITDGDVKRMTEEQVAERKAKAEEAERKAIEDAKAAQSEAKADAAGIAQNQPESPLPQHDPAAPAAAPVAQEPAPQVGTGGRHPRR